MASKENKPARVRAKSANKPLLLPRLTLSERPKLSPSQKAVMTALQRLEKRYELNGLPSLNQLAAEIEAAGLPAISVKTISGGLLRMQETDYIRIHVELRP